MKITVQSAHKQNTENKYCTRTVSLSSRSGNHCLLSNNYKMCKYMLDYKYRPTPSIYRMLNRVAECGCAEGRPVGRSAALAQRLSRIARICALHRFTWMRALECRTFRCSVSVRWIHLFRQVNHFCSTLDCIGWWAPRKCSQKLHNAILCDGSLTNYCWAYSTHGIFKYIPQFKSNLALPIANVSTVDQI